MKRSLLDPIPRPLSTQALVVLVALVVCGTGVAVTRYLDSDPRAQESAPRTIHAAPAEADPWLRPLPASRPSSRGTMTRVGGGGSGVRTPMSTAGSGLDADSAPTERGPATSSCTNATREVQPTLARPTVQGT